MKPIRITIITAVVSASLLSGCEAEVVKDEGMSQALAAAEAKLAQMADYEAEIAAVKTWVEIWDSADVDKLDGIIHSDFVRTAPDVSVDNLEDLKAFILQAHEAYPDFSISNDAMAAGPDGVFVQWTVTGTDSGPSEDATGRPINVVGISRYQFSEGKVASELVIFDSGYAASQLGTTEMPHAKD